MDKSSFEFFLIAIIVLPSICLFLFCIPVKHSQNIKKQEKDDGYPDEMYPHNLSDYEGRYEFVQETKIVDEYYLIDGKVKYRIGFVTESSDGYFGQGDGKTILHKVK